MVQSTSRFVRLNDLLVGYRVFFPPVCNKTWIVDIILQGE